MKRLRLVLCSAWQRHVVEAWTTLFRKCSVWYEHEIRLVFLFRYSCILDAHIAQHILAFHPPTFPELDVSSNLQTAAILGIGLLYQGLTLLHFEILMIIVGAAEISTDVNINKSH